MKLTKRLTLKLMIVGVAAVLAAALLFSTYHSSAFSGVSVEVGQQAKADKQREPSDLEKQFGVQAEGVYLTSGGFFLDFRYRVLDVEKASAIINRKVSPVLINLESGSRLLVPNTPKVGALRQTRMQPNRQGKTQFMLFANPGSRIKVGEKVKVTIGDFTTDVMVVN
jgi:hypothetical protein